jgi:hypothetical protein
MPFEVQQQPLGPGSVNLSMLAGQMYYLLGNAIESLLGYVAHIAGVPEHQSQELVV